MALSHEDLTKDWYSVLGVPQTATAADIKKAYRKLARELHPDTNPGDAKAEQRFKDVGRAYAIVGDEAVRQEYDEARRLGVGSRPPGGGFGGNPGGAGGVNIGDLFGNLFGGGGRQQPRAQRGEDLGAEVTVSFEAALLGVETTVRLPGAGACATCHGSGAKPGTQPTQCQRCHGTGSVSTNQGPFAFAQPCPVCGGQGVTISDPCPTCHGSGATDRNVAVRLPVGVADGQRVRVRGRGGPGQRGGPAGDLEVLVHVTPHPLFTREARNVAVVVPVSFKEAALGTKVRVPTPDGKGVTINVPAGTQPGARLRVRGRGVPASGSKAAGDLFVQISVEVPVELTAETIIGSIPPADRSRLEAWLPAEAKP